MNMKPPIYPPLHVAASPTDMNMLGIEDATIEKTFLLTTVKFAYCSCPSQRNVEMISFGLRSNDGLTKAGPL